MEKREYLRGIVLDSFIDHFPPPPIEFPLSDGEIENFPRHLYDRDRELYSIKNFSGRREYYRGLLVQISANTRRPGHGLYVIILVPETFERILRQITLLPGHKSEEVKEALWQMYYQGKILGEIETDVCSRTLTRYLQRAEGVLDILGEHRSRPLEITLRAITLSYRVLRLGRDAWLDVRKYLPDRIF